MAIGDRRSVKLTIYKIDSITALPDSARLPDATQVAGEEALLFSEIHFPRSTRWPSSR